MKKRILALYSVIAIGGLGVSEAEDVGKLTPSYKYVNDSLKISLKVENHGKRTITVNFSRFKVVQYWYGCSNSDGLILGHNYDDVPDCLEFRKDQKKYLSQLSDEQSKDTYEFCSHSDWESIRVTSNSKTELNLLSKKLPKCDSVNFGVTINKGQYEIKN